MPNIRIIVGKQFNPHLNLAVESILTDEYHPNTITMFLWKNQQTVVIGTNQNPYSECNVRQLLEDGGHIARRRTGGGAVYHDLGNLNFSFVADKTIYNVDKQLSVIQNALATLGLKTEKSGRNDITYQGRKFSGNAFFSGKQQNLHHGTILIKTDADRMMRYLIVNQSKLKKNGVKSVASRIVNLSEVADITSDSIVPLLIESFEKTYDQKAEVIDFEKYASLEKTISLKEHYESEEFLFDKWRHFKTYKKEQFQWGNVDISLSINEDEDVIENINIASDCLQLSAIEDAHQLLKGASLTSPPSIENLDNQDILKDILSLLYY